MKLTIYMAISLAGTTLAQNSTFTTSTTAPPSTTIVSTLTTVCGSATVLIQNGNYYTCTEAMTLTITDCPCTMAHQPISIMTYAAASTTTASKSTIIVPGYCPSIAPTYAQGPAQGQAGYTPACQGVGGAAGSSPSIGTAMLPSATHGGYAITNSAGAVSVGKAAIAVLIGSVVFCALLM